MIPYLGLMLVGLVGGIIVMVVMAVAGTAILNTILGASVVKSSAVGAIIWVEFIFVISEGNVDIIYFFPFVA